MRFLNGFLMLLLLILQVRLWVGDGSIGNVVALNKKIEEQTAINAKIAERNARLAAEVLSLQQGYDGIEAYARSELGMIKPDETFYLVLDKDTAIQ